jgi:uracil-DNA glycosylase family 4
MFIGEAPGRLGADISAIPFHGDKAGQNFEELLESAGLARSDVFITNAALCNPKDLHGNNAPPTLQEINNCSGYLREQIELVQPAIVVTLGAAALKATSLISSHELVLNQDVRAACPWYGRTLIPLYHPGQRAMVHRKYEQQKEDYKFVAQELRRRGFLSAASSRTVRVSPAEVANVIAATVPGISYFALHKLFYLFELDQMKRHGRPLTRAFFIRQKDGPYCVDLHPAKLKKASLNLKPVGKQGTLTVASTPADLFGHVEVSVPDGAWRKELAAVLEKNGRLTDSQLKTRVYLTLPMRRLLRLEKVAGTPTYNVPIEFAA